jgi:hypothetical protein
MWPQFSVSCSGKSIKWIGPIQPTPVSNTYKVSVSYVVGGYPAVHVLDPELTVREGEAKLPHVYPGKELCLYVPAEGQWSPASLISETTLPWTSLWLYFYEVWHSSGQWLGGGKHPVGGGQKTPK